ncbi:hypothetical protein AB3S75_044465 [Citrus x aurantiifolia]
MTVEAYLFFLVIAISAGSNFTQTLQFDKLSKVSNNIQIDVIRNGRRQQISIFEIVVGDVICLKIGDQVPADGLFLDGHSLQVDESSMTGESDHLEVNSSQNLFLFSGTKVADGYARMLATSVGMNTTWGQRMSQISRDNSEQTPLQARLNELTSSTGKIGLAVAFLVLVVLLLRYFTGNTTDENGNQEYNGSKTKVDDIVNVVVGIVAATVTIIVVAIPEGLPLAVTLTLAYSMKRMMADQAMVRKLSACETMGSATTIGTDKTGTLTENRMKVSKFWLGKELVKEADASSVSPNIIKLIQEGVALNTTGSVYRETSVSDVEFSGSPTEKAILSWAVLEMNIDMEEVNHPLVERSHLSPTSCGGNLLAQAFCQIAALLTLQFRGESIFGVNEKVKDTLIFNTFVLCQVFNEFNARKLEKKNVFEGIHKNRLFLGIIGTTIVLQVVMVEFLKKFADTERLNWGQWSACIGLAAASWPIGWLVKCIPVPAKPFSSYLKWKK